MNITLEKVDDLNSILKVEMAKEDYLPVVDAAIKKYRKTVSMKGFRQGMVPTSMVKKMYGNSILYEEVNKLVTGQINNHIQESKLEILGQPLPKEDSKLTLDIQQPEDLTLEYELGMVPEFDTSFISKDSKFSRYVVQLDDTMLEEEVDNLKLRHGEMGYPEDTVTQDKDVLHMDILELANGMIKEGGVHNNGPIGINIFKEEAQKQFIGMKPGDTVDVDLFEISDRDRESILKFVLDIKEGEPEGMGSTFRMTLEKIGRMTPSELNEDFFGKVYGPGVIETEEAFRARLRQDLENYFGQQADIKFKNDLTSSLLENVKMDFPDTFLKRWIKVTNEKPITDEQVDADFENFTKGLRWSLITNKLGAENDIKAEKEDIEAHSMEMLRQQLEQYNPQGNSISDEELKHFNASMMAREDHVKKTYEAVMEQKLFAFIEDTVTIEEKEVTLDEFRNLGN
ncbi:MAG: trigger factor [Bacteroidetes bacterium]|nr:trigger factor [Bacteroidota bacterium]